MLDERTLKLLNIINGLCQSSGYKIFSLSELVFSMPERFLIDEECIRQSLKTLAQKEYISVKYEDQTEVCLSILPKGRLVFEKNLDAELQSAKINRHTFLYAFLGAVLGGFSVGIISIILFLVFGGK